MEDRSVLFNSATMSYPSNLQAIVDSSSSSLESPFQPLPRSSSTHSNQRYLDGGVCDSPPASHRSESVDESDVEEVDSDTDSTLDDEEVLGNSQFGHPLERMPRLKSADHGLEYNYDAELDALLRTLTCSSGYPSRSSSVTSLGTDNRLYFDEIVKILLEKIPNPFISYDSRNLVMFDPPKGDTPHHLGGCLPPLMVKRLKRSSSELLLLLELNAPKLRADPWNAAPHILQAVEREEYVYLCMQLISEYNNPPLVNVVHYIDFFRQVLEGLSFLHEQQIAGFNCNETSSYLVDLSSAPHAPEHSNSNIESKQPIPQFDRNFYPVRYYFVNFSQAIRAPLQSLSPGPSSSPASPTGEARTRAACPFKRDVQDCGMLFERLLDEASPIAAKLKSLTKAMTLGGFSADDSRRLFEALCRSIPADVFEMAASCRPTTDRLERAHTIAHSMPHLKASLKLRGKVPSR